MTAQERMTKTYSDIDEIEISVSSGDIIIRKASGNEITVELEHTFNFDYDPEFRESGSKLDISDNRTKTRYNSYSGSATWTLTIPDNLSVEFDTGSGDAEISDLSIEFEMNSGSGDFGLRNAKGEIEVKTGSGDIDIVGAEGELELTTGSGDIELEEVVAEIDATTGSGNVDAESVELSERSSFSSGSGDVEVVLAKSPDFDISVSSGSGDASLDFSGQKIEGLVVMQINKHRGRIRAPFDFDTEDEIDEGRNTRLRKTKKFGNKDIEIRISTGSGTAAISE